MHRAGKAQYRRSRLTSNVRPHKTVSSLPYILRTVRLGFRQYVSSDSDASGGVFADPYSARFYPAMNQQDGLDRWINWNLKNYDEFGFGLWALELLDSGTFIGDAGITYPAVEGELILEIGWHIHSAFRSRGYATEAGKACLEFGFSSLRATSLNSIVDPQNSASMTVASRVHENMRKYQGKNGEMLLYYTAAPSAA